MSRGRRALVRRLRRLTRHSRWNTDVDYVLAAYTAWKAECAAVRAAYKSWTRAPMSDTCFAFVAYRIALDREERAAAIYARRLSRARRQPEFDVARQLAQLPVPFGAT